MTVSHPPSVKPTVAQVFTRMAKKHGKPSQTGPRGYVVPDDATVDGVPIGQFMQVEGLQEVSKAIAQKIILPMPRGDLTLPDPDARVLRRQVGADEARLKSLFIKNNWGEVTVIRCWHHAPTDLLVIATIDKTDNFGELLHVSVSYKDHDPSWQEIKSVRSAFFPPFVDVMMMLPDEAYYVNIAKYCYHIWACPSPWNIG